MKSWQMEDIDWDAFDEKKIKPELLPLIQTAALVEHNGKSYASYLSKVFADDAELIAVIEEWALEEVKHGQALRKWAEMANPNFNFEDSFARFTAGYKLPETVSASVRGSQAGEMLARCVVEAGTSSYYTAISEYSDEPVLRQICKKIAADEFRHYKLFYTHFNHYLAKDKMGMLKRIKIVAGRVLESEDDELAYAFYAACDNPASSVYKRDYYAGCYIYYTRQIYQRFHIDRMTSMIFKAVGFKPHSKINNFISSIVWNGLRMKARLMSSKPGLHAFALQRSSPIY